MRREISAFHASLQRFRSFMQPWRRPNDPVGQGFVLSVGANITGYREC